MDPRLASTIREVVHRVDSVVHKKVRVIPSSMTYVIPEQENLKKFIEFFKVDCVFDVGANVGQYARMLRSRVGYRGTIISFEPNPKCASVLRRNSQNDPRWHIEELALSDKYGEIEFNLMTDSVFGSISKPTHKEYNLLQHFNRVEKVISVKTRTIDDYYDELSSRYGFSRPYLKMDTQGNDFRVASGADEKLSQFVGLQSELSFLKLYENTVDYYQLIEFYKSKGFALTAIIPNTSGHFPKLVEMDCIMYNEKALSALEATELADSSS